MNRGDDPCTASPAVRALAAQSPKNQGRGEQLRLQTACSVSGFAVTAVELRPGLGAGRGWSPVVVRTGEVLFWPDPHWRRTTQWPPLPQCHPGGLGGDGWWVSNERRAEERPSEEVSFGVGVSVWSILHGAGSWCFSGQWVPSFPIASPGRVLRQEFELSWL